MTYFLFEIDGELDTEQYSSVELAKSEAKSRVEDNRDTDAIIIIYELKPVSVGQMKIEMKWGKPE